MIEGKHEAVTIKAGADLSAMQYKIVTVGGVMAAANITALGVLQNAPLSGEHATVAWKGNMKAALILKSVF